MFESDPFILFEDAGSEGGLARYFDRPRSVVIARSLDEVPGAIAALRAGLRHGRHAAGWFSYEAGFAFEPRLRPLAGVHGLPTPLLWFGLFDQPRILRAGEVEAALPDPESAWLAPPRPRITRAAYERAFAKVRSYIVAGDLYQANLSYRADVAVSGPPLGAYARVRKAGAGGWSGIVRDGDRWLLSTSPELFFKLSDGKIEARPMKGTAKRQADPAEDREAAEALRHDPKQLAENVMIVDLLRNDLSRVAKRGSVAAPQLFTLETYPTVHTLTSTVTAEVKDGCDALDVLCALFPCGSVTGAPKIRAMEIIAELEHARRGIYTGSMGWFSPDGDAEFNVAIRTLDLCNGRAEIGLGSAVVFDSTMEEEWEECAAKGAFVAAHAPRFELLETMRFDPATGIELLDLHLVRLRNSALELGFAYDESAVRTAIVGASSSSAGACLVRVKLSPDGTLVCDVEPPRSFAGGEVLAGVAALPVANDDFRLRHKTTLRGVYDAARAEHGAEEVVFVDRAGFVTEGSFTNVFVERDGLLLTPPESRGLLPGVLRASLLSAGQAVEGELRLTDLAAGFLLGNAARGMTRARLNMPTSGKSAGEPKATQRE